MGAERKLLTCRNCSDPFTVPVSKGQYPQFCAKDDCQQARKTGAKQLYASLSEADKERRREQARKRWAERREAAGIEPESEKPETPQQRTLLDLTGFEPELIEAGLIAGDRRLASRTELRTNVRRLVDAEGIEDTYAALVEIAATTIAWAARIRPPARDIEPAYDRVPKHIEDADYEELMAA